MRSSSTQIANQISVCWRGVLGCVDQWVQQPTSQPNQARQKRNWPPEKGFNSYHASTGTRTARWPALLAGLPYSPIYIKPLCLLDIGRTTARATDAVAGRCACSWWVMAPCTSLL